MDKNLIDNLDRLHTTELGRLRIAKNLGLEPEEVVSWCKSAVEKSESIVRAGKNYSVKFRDVVVTVNASAFTIITAHRQKKASVKRPSVPGLVSAVIGIAFDCPDADLLADFYCKLTGWKKEISGGEWAGLRTPEDILLVFQTVENYLPPVWPWEAGKQQQQAHIDFKTDDLEQAVARAIELGAKKSPVQYYDTSVTMFDPAGHPFCLSTVMQ